MIPTSRAWLNALRLGLLASTCGWGISFFFTFSTWEVATNQLYEMGANTIPYDPLLNYWMKMASATFGCIGIASALACAAPHAYMGLIRLLGPFHFFIAITLVIAAYQNHLTTSLHPTFVPDITFCVIAGTLIQLPLSHSWRTQVKKIVAS